MSDIQYNDFTPEEEKFCADLYTIIERVVRLWVRERHLRWETHEFQDFTSKVYTFHIFPKWKQLYGRPKHSIWAFISNGVRWALFRQIKQQGKQPLLLADAAALERLPNARYEPNQAARIDYAEAVTWVEQALQTLSPYERAVWILKERYVWPYERIAKRLRKRNLQRRAMGSLYVANLRAKRKIMAYLEEKVIRA